MNDISKDKDYQEFFAGIKELAKGLMQIRESSHRVCSHCGGVLCEETRNCK